MRHYAILKKLTDQNYAYRKASDASRKNQVGGTWPDWRVTLTHYDELPEEKDRKPSESANETCDHRSCPGAIGGCRVKSRSHAKTRAARQPFSVKAMPSPSILASPVDVMPAIRFSYIHGIPLPAL